MGDRVAKQTTASVVTRTVRLIIFIYLSTFASMCYVHYITILLLPLWYTYGDVLEDISEPFLFSLTGPLATDKTHLPFVFKFLNNLIG